MMFMLWIIWNMPNIWVLLIFVDPCYLCTIIRIIFMIRITWNRQNICEPLVFVDPCNACTIIRIIWMFMIWIIRNMPNIWEPLIFEDLVTVIFNYNIWQIFCRFPTQNTLRKSSKFDTQFYTFLGCSWWWNWFYNIHRIFWQIQSYFIFLSVFTQLIHCNSW